MSGSPAAFPSNQFEMATAFADNKGLDDTLFPDGIGQFAQRFGRKIFAGLEWAGVNPFERHALHLFPRIGRGHALRNRG